VIPGKVRYVRTPDTSAAVATASAISEERETAFKS
jgi:hypothetical protein